MKLVYQSLNFEDLSLIQINDFLEQEEKISWHYSQDNLIIKQTLYKKNANFPKRYYIHFKDLSFMQKIHIIKNEEAFYLFNSPVHACGLHYHLLYCSLYKEFGKTFTKEVHNVERACHLFLICPACRINYLLFLIPTVLVRETNEFLEHACIFITSKEPITFNIPWKSIFLDYSWQKNLFGNLLAIYQKTIEQNYALTLIPLGIKPTESESTINALLQRIKKYLHTQIINIRIYRSNSSLLELLKTIDLTIPRISFKQICLTGTSFTKEDLKYFQVLCGHLFFRVHQSYLLPNLRKFQAFFTTYYEKQKE